MIEDPINIVWTLIGISVWPGLTACIILWKLGHPLLGILALLMIDGSCSCIQVVYRQVR